MTFEVDSANPLPIYAQLVAQIRRAIGRGELRPGYQLPTVRSLAVDLRINPNTVARAYTELERAGLIATQQGRGTFVLNGARTEANEEREARLCALTEHLLGEATALGYTPEDVIVLIDQIRSRSEGDGR